MNETLNSQEILAALERVLKSRTFERSERARDLLQYLVQQDVEGKSDAIKGFSIAVDVFGRDASFDPATDPLVRVHAGRLRELLATYYAGEGKGEQLVISIPTGRYVPEYSIGVKDVTVETVDMVSATSEREENTVSGLGAETEFGQTSISGKKAILIGLIALLVSLAAVSFTEFPSSLWSRVTVDRKDASQDERASASQLPVLQVITNLDDKDLVAFADRLNSGLSAFDTITTLQTRPLSVLDRRRGKWSALEYGLKLSKTGGNSANETPVILVELLSLADDKVMRVEEYASDVWDQSDNSRLVAQKLTSVASPEGAIYADIIAKGDTNPVMDCLGKVRIYYGLSNGQTHREAYECAKALSGQEGASGLVFAIYGGLIAEAAGKSFDYQELPVEAEEAMRLALNTALKGVDIDPLSARAAREVGFVYSWQGAFSVMADWFARANELNPNDTSVAASYGYGLVLSGKYSEAIPVFRNAIGASTRHPSWWDFYYALALLMEDRFDEAGEAIIPMGLSKRSLLYSMLNAVLAYRKGNRHRAAFLVRFLRERYPKFAANPRGSFQKRHYPEGLINNLVEALEKSGLSSTK